LALLRFLSSPLHLYKLPPNPTPLQSTLQTTVMNLSSTQADCAHKQPLPADSTASNRHSLSNSSTEARASSGSSSRSSSTTKSSSTQFSVLADGLHQCPYNIGFTTTALRHEPPDPFDPEHTRASSSEELANLNAMSQIDFCMSYQLLPGRTMTDQTSILSITSVIRTGPRRGAQLVVMNNSLVAKIYDPLYYDPSDDLDVVRHADEMYSHEAAAYTHLQKVPEVSDLVPKFHGSWTIGIPINFNQDGATVSQLREVRLILIEHLDSIPMTMKDPHTLSEYARSVILAQCIDAEVRLLNTGLNHTDFVPRNIILQGSDYETPNIQVKVIDFDWCDLLFHPKYFDPSFAQDWMESKAKWAPLLPNPVKRWTNLRNFAQLGWCSQNRSEWRSWLWDVFGHDDRYRPVRWDPDRPRIPPRYVNQDGEVDDSGF
jgi:hypothetical protein